MILIKCNYLYFNILHILNEKLQIFVNIDQASSLILLNFEIGSQVYL